MVRDRMRGRAAVVPLVLALGAALLAGGCSSSLALGSSGVGDLSARAQPRRS